MRLCSLFIPQHTYKCVPYQMPEDQKKFWVFQNQYTQNLSKRIINISYETFSGRPRCRNQGLSNCHHQLHQLKCNFEPHFSSKRIVQKEAEVS